VVVATARAEPLPALEELLAAPVQLRRELADVHPRVFLDAGGLERLRARTRGPLSEAWATRLQRLTAIRVPPPPPPGPQARRAQNGVALALAEVALAAAVDRTPALLSAARAYLLAAIEYEPWGYVSNKPNVDLAAGHLLYTVGWAYDLLHADLSPDERQRVRGSLARHAGLVADHFAPKPGRRFAYTQNHDFIPTAGLGIAALALFGEVPEAPRWAALARAHQHRTATLLSPDGFFYEGFEYWIFSAPWLIHFLDAWEHATGESLWELGPYRRWPLFVAHTVLPDGAAVFDFGDVWEGPATRARRGEDAARVYPDDRGGATGGMQSNYGVLHRIAARLDEPSAHAVAERLLAFGHTNQEELWAWLWRDASLERHGRATGATLEAVPLVVHFADSGVAFGRTSWTAEATAWAFKAGPPQGHRIATRLPALPDVRLSSGHVHPDVGSFILFAGGRYLVGDTGYAGRPAARDHNTVTVDGRGQGAEGTHDVWRALPYATLTDIRLTAVELTPRRAVLRAACAAAYAPEVGLARFDRTFVFQAPDTFRIVDDLVTDRPRSFAWHLHADAPFAGTGARYSLAPAPATDAAASSPAPQVGLDITVHAPRGVRGRTAETEIVGPGPPGAVEAGTPQPRGYELVLHPPGPARRMRFDVRLRVRRPRRP
jgi:hypothetical protein